ncbi:capsular polysaccharide export protein, LipB/KpsS family [Halobacillus salinus]|uniref:capsular polysaccharide export protein, LipB/KpsS family n=1 Tax=Halobacillus salinus TaxID=192814 RepID=UPI0009A733C3|nr:hypothetical protein [Halobacillus salinus]
MKKIARKLRKIVGRSAFMKIAVIQKRLMPKIKTKKKVAFLLGFSSWKHLHIRAFLKDYDVKFIDEGTNLDIVKNKTIRYKDCIFMVWGYKESKQVREYAKRNHIPFYRIEDGFIRSVALGVSKSQPLSLCIDSQGLYYDATQPSDLEDILNTYDFASDSKLINRAGTSIQRLLELSVSKYNNVRSKNAEELYGQKKSKRILVIGQVEDDESIKRGCDKDITNNELVWLAKTENPDAEIIYKPHPDVLSGMRPKQSDPNDIKSIAKVIEEPISISDSFKTIDHVYTITSLAGFEALLRGIPVTTVGAPFYSGWGLTDDRQRVSRRKRKLTIEEVFAAAYILYPKYQHPFTKEFIKLEDAISTLDQMRNLNSSGGEKRALTYDFTESECGVVTKLTNFSNIQNTSSIEDVVNDSGNDTTVIFKNSSHYREQFDLAKSNNLNAKVVSTGMLGDIYNTDDVINLSYSMDSTGSHHDASSELVRLLNDFDLNSHQDTLSEAKLIMRQVIDQGTSGYNPSHFKMTTDVLKPDTKERILLLGKSEPDTNLYDEDSDITNRDLIWSAKLENPEAELLYRPHPNDSKLDSEELTYESLKHLVTVIKDPIPLAKLFREVDQVYTIHSKAGFEATWRGLETTVLGSPFYAGFGFTNDKQDIKRKRNLSVEEAFFITYLVYTNYVNPFSKKKIELSQALELSTSIMSLESSRELTQKRRKTIKPDAYQANRISTKVEKEQYYNLSTIENEENSKIGVLSKGMLDIPHLEAFVKGQVVEKPKNNDDDLDFVAGWGKKPSAKKALDFSEKYNLKYLALEDGFLRSIGLGVDGTPPLSLCIDDIGIYYDATTPSRLEWILNSDGWQSRNLLEQAEEAMSLIKQNYLSKYNTGPLVDKSIFKENNRKRILLVDQTYGDMSIELGLATSETFKQMYKHAVRNNPEADIYIKTHPDVISGKKQGNLSKDEVSDQATFIYENYNPVSLVEQVDSVYVVTSQLGFEALMLGKEVHCFGMPFYAGWGLTNDQLVNDRRSKKRNLTEVFAASYILYPRYINPDTNTPGTIFDVINHLVKYKS